MRAAVAVSVSLLVLAGCGAAPPKSPPTGVDELTVPTPSPDPDDFVEGIDNPWLPLTPGRSWTYEETSEDGTATVTVTVTDQTKVVAGVTTTVVHDVVTAADGTVLEDTYDWFAQDRSGNVWYFGEATTAYDEGTPTTEGSWEAGVDGAEAGIAMLAEPRVGDGYQMEFLEGEAEDRAEVLETDAEITAGPGSTDYTGVLKTEDTTPLEPDVVEHKYYALGVGLVHEETVEGGDEVVRLVTTRE